MNMGRRVFFGKFFMAVAAVTTADALKTFKIYKFSKNDIVPDWILHTKPEHRHLVKFGTNVIAYKRPDKVVVRTINQKKGEYIVGYHGNEPTELIGKPTHWICC